MTQTRVVLAMSGGVDSSVAAHLLKKNGFDVIGVFMRHGNETSVCPTNPDTPLAPASSGSLNEPLPTLPIIAQASKQGCCTARDAEDARNVAGDLQIPFYALNLQDDFDRIIDYFVDEYELGRTPNPCVMCNNWLKFGRLFDYADSIGATYVATGHYARTMTAADSPKLLRGLDEDKDQSYVLFGVRSHYLSRMLLPIGEYRKEQIRSMAREFGLRVAEKPDSQEICFVSQGQHADLVAQRRTRDTTGQIVTTDGTVVAQHRGIEAFTVGQRKGLGVAMGEPYFVVRIDPTTNQVVIGKKSDLACRQLTAKSVNWLVPPIASSFRCLAQIRYNSRAKPATAFMDQADTLHVDFDEARHGVAPGQAVVCYDGDQVLCGGWIESTKLMMDHSTMTGSIVE